MTRILVVDDEPHICALVTRALAGEGYETVTASDGQDAIDLVVAQEPDIDLIVLDVGLPTLDGVDVLRLVRARGISIPVIMLTARSSTRDTIEGLDAGAADYVTKPFAVAELLARVRSQLRERPASVVLTRGPVTLDVLTRRTTVAGRTVDLSAREFALAEQFLRKPGETLTREALLSTVWGIDFDPSSNVVDVYVRYLRSKLGPEHIVTVRGAGYRWE